MTEKNKSALFTKHLSIEENPKESKQNKPRRKQNPNNPENKTLE